MSDTRETFVSYDPMTNRILAQRQREGCNRIVDSDDITEKAVAAACAYIAANYPDGITVTHKYGGWEASVESIGEKS